jgi:hypothetical protein
MKTISTLFLLFALIEIVHGAQGVEKQIRPSDDLIAALVRVESGGNVEAIGDKNLRNHAYGPLQVRQTVCDDVNMHFSTHYVAASCLGNLNVSKEIFHRYMQIYWTAKNLGHAPRIEDCARIWNGGPTGARKSSTQYYWTKVQVELARHSSKKNVELTQK